MRARARLTAPVVVCLAALAGPRGAPAENGSPPRVQVISTGGTIATHRGGRMSGEQLVRLVPDLGRHAAVEVEEFSSLDSNALTPEHCLALARRIDRLFVERPDLAGVVVTIGTDTLEEVAYFLNLTVRSERPVVLAGALRSSEAPGYDGAANLLAAVRVAGAPESRTKGALVVLNDEIHAARDVAKRDTARLQAFDSRDHGLLGLVAPDAVVYYRTSVKRNTARSEFDPSRIGTLPRVDIVTSYLGASGDLVRAAADAGARGIVIAGTGTGNTTASQAEGIAYATGRGAVVVFSSRTGGGRVAEGAAGWVVHRPADPQWRPRGRIAFAEDLSPVKARILLMLALATTHDGAEVQRMFSEY